MDVGSSQWPGGGQLSPIAEGIQEPQSPPIASQSPVERKKALLIGICNSVGYSELKASHSDVYGMRAMLIDTWKYTESQITVLVDDGVDSHPQPTRVNILKAIADFVSDVRDGDHLFFHYAGHSTQINSNTEEDGKDECLVPSDGDDHKIVDDELHACLIKPLPAGSHLVALLDTCHAGSLLDLKHYRCNRVFVPWRWRGNRLTRNNRTRRGAMMMTLSQTTGENSPAAPQQRRSVITVMCDPPAAPAPSSAAPPAFSPLSSITPTAASAPQSRTPTSASYPGTSTARGPLARIRTMSMSWARSRSTSSATAPPLSPLSSSPAPAASAPQSRTSTSASYPGTSTTRFPLARIRPMSWAPSRSTSSATAPAPLSSSPASAPQSRTPTSLSHPGTSTSRGPLARIRTRARSKSVPQAAKENLTEGDVGRVLPALSNMKWFMPEETLHCESPVGQFPCNGWCRDVDGHSTTMEADSGDDGVKADVISLASCRDSQQAWEGPGGVSMSSRFVDLMREDPDRSLNEVMLHISHAAYSLSLVRHARSKEYKGKLEAYVARRIAYIRQSASVSVFRDRAPSLATTLNPTIRAAKSAAVKLKLVTNRHGVVPGLRRALNRDVEALDKSNFQNPELASPQPLDMNRRLRL